MENKSQYSLRESLLTPKLCGGFSDIDKYRALMRCIGSDKEKAVPMTKQGHAFSLRAVCLPLLVFPASDL